MARLEMPDLDPGLRHPRGLRRTCRVISAHTQSLSVDLATVAPVADHAMMTGVGLGCGDSSLSALSELERGTPKNRAVMGPFRVSDKQ